MGSGDGGERVGMGGAGFIKTKIYTYFNFELDSYPDFVFVLAMP